MRAVFIILPHKCAKQCTSWHACNKNEYILRQHNTQHTFDDDDDAAATLYMFCLSKRSTRVCVCVVFIGALSRNLCSLASICTCINIYKYSLLQLQLHTWTALANRPMCRTLSACLCFLLLAECVVWPTLITSALLQHMNAVALLRCASSVCLYNVCAACAIVKAFIQQPVGALGWRSGSRGETQDGDACACCSSSCAFGYINAYAT